MSGNNWYLQSRLKTRHLELLTALDKYRNMHRAADSIGLAQPAASKLLGDLEAALDQKLFERHAKGLEPNEYGEVLIRRAEMILAELRGAGDELNGLRKGDMGQIEIGTIDAATLDHVVPAIKAVQLQHPRLQIGVKVGTSDVLMRDITGGSLDFAICHLEDVTGAADVVYDPLGHETLSLICRVGHPLQGTGRLQPADLQSFPWVMKPVGSRNRQSIEGMFHRNGLPIPSQVISTGSVIITLAHLASSDAISAMASALAMPLQALNHMHILQFSETLQQDAFGIVQLRNRRLSAGAGLLRRTLLEQGIEHA